MNAVKTEQTTEEEEEENLGSPVYDAVASMFGRFTGLGGTTTTTDDTAGNAKVCDDDDDDLTPKQPPRSSHKEEEEDKEIVRKQAVFKEEDKETEDLLPKREAASFREMNICVCFCVVLSCFVWVFPLGKNSILFRSFKEHLHMFLRLCDFGMIMV